MTVWRRRGALVERLHLSVATLIDIGLVIALTVLMAIYFRDRRAAETVIAVVVPLLLRRVAPVPVLIVLSLGVVATVASAVWVDIACLAVAAFTVGDLVADRSASAGIVLLTAGGLAIALVAEQLDAAPSLVLPFVVLVPTWVVGTLVRGRRVEADARELERVRAAADREATLQRTIADQRRTIARELHDVVAHAVSVMVIQAGAARSVLHTSPEAAETSLLAVESTGREAMAELRRLLDLLADRDDAAAIAPQSGLAQIETLVARVREAGLPLSLEVDGTPRDLPAGMDVTIYRIVQEALTNALRYAGRAHTVVHLAFADTAVEIEVIDDGPGAAGTADVTPKRGLIGMRERAAMFGGRVDAGPRAGRGYAVHAWLPTGQGS